MPDCPDPIEKYYWMRFPIEVEMNPTVTTFPSGKTWAISGETWIQVPADTSREDLSKWMKWKRPVSNTETVKVEGSRGNVYTVKRHRDTGNITCSCPGFKYHGKCKHSKVAFVS